MTDDSAPSGIKIQDPKTGRTRPVTFRELANIAAQVKIDPNLLLDVEAEMVGEVFNGQSFAKVRALATSLAGEKAYEPAPDLSNSGIMALTVRLQAAGELRRHSWMERILIEAMGHDHVMPSLGRYYATAPLCFSPRLHGLVFSDSEARKALEHLTETRH